MSGVYQIDDDPDIETSRLIVELKNNALLEKKPSDFSLSKKDLLEKARLKLENREISEDTYYSIEEKLLK